MPWSADDIAATAARALQDAAARLDAEQAVRGLDAMDELALHPILAAAFEGDRLGVLREQPFPGAIGHPLRRERERCDLVLTDRPGVRLLDPVGIRRERRAATGTLFEQQIAGAPPTDGVPCDEAMWIEVKIVGQFCFTDDVPGPNATYVSDMTACLRDLAKLAKDPIILHAATMSVMFAESRATLRHDFGVVLDRALAKDLPIGGAAIETFAIADRIGNAVAGVGVIPLRKATVVGGESPQGPG